jgi:hypothetical protein
MDKASLTLIAAALFLKNIAFKYWTIRQDTDPFMFHADDKATMREHMLSTIVQSPDLIRCRT